MKKSKGFSLIFALLACSLLLVVAIGFLSARPAEYQTSQNAVLPTQALFAAQAGLEDVAQKIHTDADFPSADAGNGELFSYCETLDTNLSYVVTIDKRLAISPWIIWQIRVTGIVGPADNPTAKRTLSAEIDVSPLKRDGSGAPNPNLFKMYQIYDGGNI